MGKCSCAGIPATSVDSRGHTASEQGVVVSHSETVVSTDTASVDGGPHQTSPVVVFVDATRGQVVSLPTREPCPWGLGK